MFCSGFRSSCRAFANGRRYGSSPARGLIGDGLRRIFRTPLSRAALDDLPVLQRSDKRVLVFQVAQSLGVEKNRTYQMQSWLLHNPQS
jgi:hypothetical protein